MAQFKFDLAAITKQLDKFATADPTQLLEDWERIIVSDNKRGVLAGIDKDDQRMKPVTYRPKDTPQKVTRTQRNNARDATTGLGPFASGLHDNLSSGEYARLGGPPLAPRGLASRVIKNLLTGHGRDPGDSYRWYAVGFWKDVVDQKGNPFLPRAFVVRNLAGVRAWGRNQARLALGRWARDILK